MIPPMAVVLNLEPAPAIFFLGPGVTRILPKDITQIGKHLSDVSSWSVSTSRDGVTWKTCGFVLELGTV